MTVKPMRDVFVLIPARGGSKGIVGKNTRLVGGQPLIAWSIRAAKDAGCVARVVVSTDDPAIAEVAVAHGAEVPFLRPAALAQDDTPGIAPLLHAVTLLQVETPWTLLLQPTSPLRTASDIDGARALADTRAADAVVSVTPVRQHAAWHREVGSDGWMVAVETPSTRQELPRRWCPNGALYLCKTSTLLNEKTLTPARTLAWEMPASRSIDVDIEDDLVLVESLIGARK